MMQSSAGRQMYCRKGLWGGIRRDIRDRKIWGVLSGMVKINQDSLIYDNGLWAAGCMAFSRDERNGFGSN